MKVEVGERVIISLDEYDPARLMTEAAKIIRQLSAKQTEWKLLGVNHEGNTDPFPGEAASYRSQAPKPRPDFATPNPTIRYLT